MVVLALLQSACGGGSDEPSRPVQQVNIKVSWDTNREAAVNRAGGGYRVYYATAAGLALTDPAVTMVDVPYTTGSFAPVTTTVSVQSGRVYYFRVTAYSALNRAGQSGGTESASSSSFVLNVP